MTKKYENPPVIYTVAKISFKQAIGQSSRERYREYLSSLSKLGFDTYVVSNVKALTLELGGEQFKAVESDNDRIGFFNRPKSLSLLLDGNTVELRSNQHDNHEKFLDILCKAVGVLKEQEVITYSDIKELELHYVDLFYNPRDVLDKMFSVKLPFNQFDGFDNDVLKVGNLNLLRVLEPGNKKIVVNIEEHLYGRGEKLRILPQALIEPDEKLGMSLFFERLMPPNAKKEKRYALIHNFAAMLPVGLDSEVSVRNAFEEVYTPLREMFDYVKEDSECETIWNPTSRSR